MGLFWIFTIIGAVLGGAYFLITLLGATSAPQQAAGAGMALCFVVIPYCLARAIEGLRNGKKAG